LRADLFTVIGSQRACRRFLPQPVDDETLATVLRAGTHAPSAENGQPWAWIVVRNEESRQALAALAARAWEQGGRQHSRGRLTPGLFAEVDRAATSGYGAAPVHVVACADLERVHRGMVASSIFPAVQNVLLAAAGLGLGTVLTTLALTYADDVSTLLDLPDSLLPVADIPVGWPERPLGPARRRPLSEVVHLERYGQKWTAADQMGNFSRKHSSD
jgi:nitroreductase